MLQLKVVNLPLSYSQLEATWNARNAILVGSQLGANLFDSTLVKSDLVHW